MRSPIDSFVQFLRRTRGGCAHRFARGGIIAITHPNQHRSNELTLKREARSENLFDQRTRGAFRFAFDELMFFGIENFTSLRPKRNQTDASSSIVTGVLKSDELFGDTRLLRTLRRACNRVDVVQHSDSGLQPLGFAAAQLFIFESKRGFFAFVGALPKLVERFEFTGHGSRDFLRDTGGLVARLADDLPLIGEITNLRGDLFELRELRNDVGELRGFGEFAGPAVFECERQDIASSSQRGAQSGTQNLPTAQRCGRSKKQENTKGKKKCTGGNERPPRH